MGQVLVAYTTKSGSTGEVAQAIGEELQRNGVLVDVRLISRCPARWILLCRLI